MSSTQKGRKVVERILHVSKKLLLERGYQGTSTRLIAKEVGITQGNLYFHFKTKEDILLDIFDELFRKKIVIVERLTDQVTDCNLKYTLLFVLSLYIIGDDRNLLNIYLAAISSPKIRTQLINNYIDIIFTHDANSQSYTQRDYFIRFSAIYGITRNLLELLEDSDYEISLKEIVDILVSESLNLLTQVSGERIAELKANLHNILDVQGEFIQKEVAKIREYKGD